MLTQQQAGFTNASPSTTTPPPTLRLYLRNQGQQILPVSNLLYMQAETNYTWLVWANGERMLMPRTMKYYSHRLPGGWFVRLHRTHIANMHHVTGLETSDNLLYVHLKNGERIVVSRRRCAEVRSTLLQFGVW